MQLCVFRGYLIFTQAVSNTDICFSKPNLRLMWPLSTSQQWEWHL